MIEAPLSEIRVVEVSQGIAAPSCARYLAAFGAEIVKVESRDKLDITRMYSASWLPDSVSPEVRVDTSPLVDEFLAGKLSLGLDIGSEEGRRVLLRLLERSDAFLINLSAHAIESLGLTYEEVAGAREDIIYMSLPGFGSGPSRYREYRAWGPNLAPLAGIDHLTGWPDRPPSGISSFAYPDYVNACHATIALLTALLERDITDKGCHVDLSQYESCIGILGPTMMDYMANGMVASRARNDVAWAAPHGVYPCRGRDRWVAISCETDEQWRSLCDLAAGERFASDARWASHDDRASGRRELDDALGAWTNTYTQGELAARLQEGGLPAAMVQDCPTLFTDPQLEARDFFHTAAHERFGVGLFMGFPARLSDTPPTYSRAGPNLGQDNAHVLEEVIGIDPRQHERLVCEGVVYEAADPDATFRRPYFQWARHLKPTLEWPDEHESGP